MKVLYVSDNRCRGNFGCRATSIALSQIIGEKAEIVGHISGAYTNWYCGNLVVNHNWKKTKYEKIGNLKYWNHLSYALYHFYRFIDKDHFFFGKHDFISVDFDKSIENLLNCIPANKHISEYDLTKYDFDAMVVNGEGSFIFSKVPWRESVIISMLMYWAQKMGKKVYFLNAMLSDDPNSEHNAQMISVVSSVFEKCEVVQVRESNSLEFAKKYFPNLKNLVLKPDALFSWYNLINDEYRVINGKYHIPYKYEYDENFEAFDYTKPYILICASSSSIISNNVSGAISTYSQITLEAKKYYQGYSIYLLITDAGDAFLKDVSLKTNTPFIPMETNIVVVGKIIANARLFITGRYHPAILGSLGGTPCVFMGSNSHKTFSLQTLLCYPNPKEYSCLPDREDIKSIIEDGQRLLSQGNKLRNRIKERANELSIQAKSINELLK